MTYRHIRNDKSNTGYTIEQSVKLWECPDLGAGDKIKWI